LKGESFQTGECTPFHYPGEFYEAAIDPGHDTLIYLDERARVRGFSASGFSREGQNQDFTLLHGWSRPRRGRGGNNHRRGAPHLKPHHKFGGKKGLAEIRPVVGVRKNSCWNFPVQWDAEVSLLLQKMDLKLPPNSEELQTRSLSKTDLRCIERVLSRSEATPERYVRPLVMTPEPNGDDPLVAKLTEALHSEYDGEVLGTEVVPDPPIRGPYGQAYIPLKEGAVPYRTRPFSMQGEKLEAHKKSHGIGKNTNLLKGQSQG